MNTSSREFDPAGPVEAKMVEDMFVFVLPIVNLYVAGKIIGTTAEHTFFVKGNGWLSCRLLDIGDNLLAADG